MPASTNGPAPQVVAQEPTIQPATTDARAVSAQYFVADNMPTRAEQGAAQHYLAGPTNSNAAQTVVDRALNVNGIWVSHALVMSLGISTVRMMGSTTAPPAKTPEHPGFTLSFIGPSTLAIGVTRLYTFFLQTPFFLPPGYGIYHVASSATVQWEAACDYIIL